jgi:hypothetical protein
MAFTLTFDESTAYDAGLNGITLPVKLKLSDQTVDIPAKIDTGATDCIFARRFAEQLEIDVEAGEQIRFGTATGGFTAYRHDVMLSFLSYEFDVNVCFAGDENFSRNVLGRHGFLDRIVLGLVDYEGKLYLSKYGE